MSVSQTTNSPWLTLAVLVHNPKPEYLRALLNSIAYQQGNFVVDIIDDSPKPVGSYLVRNYLTDCPVSYRYLRHSDNANGLSGNWTYAVDNARTPWITVLHQDDVLTEGYTAIIKGLVEQHHSATAVFCDADVIDENGKKIFSLPDKVKKWLLRQFNTDSYQLEGERGTSALLKGNFIFCPAVCFNIKRLGKERFDERWKMVPDLELYLRLLLSNHLLVGSKHVGMHYRRHKAQATALYQADCFRFKEEFSLYQSLEQKYQAKEWVRAEKQARKATILKLHLIKDILVNLLAFRFKTAWQGVSILLEKKPHPKGEAK